MALFSTVIVLLIILMLIRIPVAYALGVCSIIAYLIFITQSPFRSFSVGLVAQRIVGGANSFPLLAIPLFLFAGKLMNEGGITDRIFDFAGTMVGRVRGGLAHMNILASLIFSGMSGAAVADVAGLGTLEIKAMRSAGYDGPFSCAVTGASAIVGPIIPPSIPMVVYGVLAGVSIGKLFLGGIIPGILMSLFLMVMVTIISLRRGYPVGPKKSPRDKVQSLIRAFLPMMAPVIIIGGIWTGIFTPTEAACVGSVYAIIICTVGYRTAGWRKLWRLAKESAMDSVAIVSILAFATLYSAVLTMLRIPHSLAEQMMVFSSNPIVVLIIINVFLLIIGFFIPAMVSINIFTSILIPIITEMGIDPVFFGVMMVLNLMIGMLTPPFGIVLFTLSKISDESIESVVREIWPFILALVMVLALLVAFPSLITFIPNNFNI